MPSSPAAPSPASAPAPLSAPAVELARRWMDEALAAQPDAAARRLDELLHGENGLPFAVGVVDGVIRPESLSAAGAGLRRLSPIVPEPLPWAMRATVRLGSGAAQVVPALAAPFARRQLRELVDHLVVDARPAKLGPALAALRERGGKPDVALLGRAVLGDEGARRRLDALHELIRRPDVERVSLFVADIVGRMSLWAFDEIVDEAVERLLPLALTALSNGTFLTLRVRRSPDLDLTIAVFTRLLEDERLRGLEAGVGVPTALPDALPAVRELTAWARDRVQHGGARVGIRLDHGIDLAAEQTEARLHGWAAAPYDARLDRDANQIRCLEEAMRASNADAVRVILADHNLFTLAYAWLLAEERGMRADLEFALALGVSTEQAGAIAQETKRVWTDVPAVDPAEFDGAAGRLVRLISDLATPEEFLFGARRIGEDGDVFAGERDLFLAALRRASDPTLHTGPRRTQNRLAPTHESVRPAAVAAAASEGDLTQAVLGIARGSEDTDLFVETAVYSPRESELAGVSASGFANAPDTDPALAPNREWARGIRERIGAVTSSSSSPSFVVGALEETVEDLRDAASAWGARPAAERSDVLSRAAAAVSSCRGELLETIAAETGMLLPDADAEITAVVDAANYAAVRARELDAVAGATFAPAELTVIVSRTASPVAAAFSATASVLAAGSGVLLVPARGAEHSARAAAEALWSAGVSRDILRIAVLDDADLDTVLAHEGVDRVLFDGPRDGASRIHAHAPARPLFAETGGKNAIIVMPSADLDLAVESIVRSAFGHAGQFRSAAAVAILVGGVGRSARFTRQLKDAVASLRAGGPDDALADLGPLCATPEGATLRALTVLDGDEKWLIAPEPVEGAFDGRLWRAGVRTGVQPSSPFLDADFRAPVLGVLAAPSLDRAIELQNAIGSGTAAGLHTQSPEDLAEWLRRASAGSLFVNRAIDDGRPQRHPFGGWQTASIGIGAKEGAPNRLIGLGAWRPVSSGATSSTLHLRGLDSRIVALIEAAQPSLDFEGFEWLRRAALSDAVAWDREFGQVRDAAQLVAERELLRYRPVPVAIRATEDAGWHELLRVVVAAIRAGARFFLSTPVGLPSAVWHTLSELGVLVAVETDEEWIARMTRDEDDVDAVDPDALPRPSRIRLVGSAAAVSTLHRGLLAAVPDDLDLAVYNGEVTPAGRIELLAFVQEQSISITAHRYGYLDDWSSEVI